MFIANIFCDRSAMNFHDDFSGHSTAKSATKTPIGHVLLLNWSIKSETASALGFNRSMQHIKFRMSIRSVADEMKNSDLLL